ncbi:Nuclear pore complex, Nup155 component (D Nup154, sc Nup157/Nup170) [Phaffia rhodozyma]|uniref:Nuclear pore complex, Nup155 component (D Nup154, sc Nup157/Nup170) n=1 Tax=Phaffia rhodozyma TaxID=264483 RepID=A0A0F7SWC5_PHARH|nr:Nuclear pore complex, Nup155 component (D Nup154, sc Nup157/Nup170) [Phaffia rhodozyma]
MLSSPAVRRLPGPPSSIHPTYSPQTQQNQMYPRLPEQTSSIGSSAAPSTSVTISTAPQTTSSSTDVIVQPSQREPVVEDPTYGPLERARKVVNEQLVKDAGLVGDLGEGLQGTSSASYTYSLSSLFSPFVKQKTFSIPDGLFAEYEALTHKCFMGIFPEIDRAWMTIDNKLFLWDFGESADFSRYDEQSEIIVHVGLVKAKPGVFIDSITHLLVICTSNNLLLLGLSRSPSSELTLYATDLTIPTDGISMSDVVSFPNGRTFMCGSDGNLYEMVYRADEGWFTKRSGLINWTGSGGGLGVLGGLIPEFLKSKQEDPIVRLSVDPTRNVIWALTKSSAIELFVVSGAEAGVGLTKVGRAGDVGRTALMLAPGAQGVLEPRGFVIMSVCPIQRGEADSGVQMVAITSKGVRLYFSYYRRGYGGVRTTTGPPTGLELIHVRLPPSNLTLDGSSASQSQPQGVSSFPGFPNQQLVTSVPPQPPIKFTSISGSAACLGGILVAPQQTAQDNMDVLLLTCPDIGRLSQSSTNIPSNGQTGGQNGLYPNNQLVSSQPAGLPAPSRPALIEQAQALPIEGRTWAIAEVPHPLSDLPCSSALKVSGRGELRLNELAAQTGVQQRSLLVLTSEGMHVIGKQRPVDVLKGILEAGASVGREGEIAAFFSNYGRDQSCAMCLALASSAESASTDTDTSPGPVSPDVVTGAKRLFYELGGKPVRVDRGYGHPGTAAGEVSSQVFFSGRHEGLAIYFSRLIRPLWRDKVTRLSPSPTSPNRQISNVAESTLVSVQRNMSALKAFIDRNFQLFTTGPASEYSQTRSSDLDSWRTEQSSVNALVAMITQAIEAISFVLLLIDYKLPETISSCALELQQSFLDLTYQDLLTTVKGRDVARNIVNAVVHQQISQRVSVETISEILQQRCGSFCRADDVLLFKALEGLRQAKETRDPQRRRECLEDSLRLFEKGTTNLPLQKLQETCLEFRSLSFPTGAIELPLKCAQDWDASGQGLAYWEDGCISTDPRRVAYENRMHCYNCVFDTLLAFDEMLDEALAAKNGSEMSIESLRASAYNQSLSSLDPLFHVTLYDWLVGRQLTDQLLEIRTPYIEQYLAREPMTHARSELLWQYYARNGHYARASVVQANLAQSTELQLPLPQRLEYLTLAVANAKSSGSSASVSVEFVNDLEEKMEVAQVQIEVLRAIMAHQDINESLKVELTNELNSSLLTISELYLNFAEPYRLLECILLILHTSDHRDPALIVQTWEGIFDQIAEEAENKMNAVASVVTQLGRRFYPSETAYPLEFLCRRLETLSFEKGNASGWVHGMLREAGVDWERIFEVFYAMFEEKLAPWNSEDAILFLSTDITALLTDWLADWQRSQSPYSQRPSSRFPVLLVEEFVTNSLLPLFSSLDESDERKQSLRGIKKALMASM